MRIISLLPAASEIVCALGLQESLVGRSHECNYPESILQLPVCSEASIPAGLSSGEIDTKVKETLADALSIYTVNRELVKQLSPDLVITQAQCEVCAVSIHEVQQALDNYLDKPAKIISLQPATLNNIFGDIETIAKAVDQLAAGEELIGNLQERPDIVGHKLKFVEARPTVACIEWLEPLMVSGNWIPGLVELAGGKNLLGTAGKHSPYINWDGIRQADPDVLIILPCGFPIGRTMREIELLLNRPGFEALQAVKNNRVYIADGDQYFNRPGPRIVDSAEILAEIIHPKLFNFGYEGEGWIRFSF